VTKGNCILEVDFVTFQALVHLTGSTIRCELRSNGFTEEECYAISDFYSEVSKSVD